MLFGINIVHHLFIELQTILGDKAHKLPEFSTLLSSYPFKHLVIFSFDILKQDIIAVFNTHGPIVDSFLNRLKLKDFLLPFNIFFLHLEVRSHLVLLFFLFLCGVIHFLFLLLLFFCKCFFRVLYFITWFSLIHFFYFFQVNPSCMFSCIKVESLQLMAFLKAFINRLEYILFHFFLSI